jgi:lipopolysaccharide/colanic/teichoic acid biosynthesis glycosyltransferase
MLGSPSEVVDLVHEHDVQRVILAFSNARHEQLLDLVRRLRDLHVQIDLVPRLFEAVGPSVGLHAVEGLPLVKLTPPRTTRLGHVLKRTSDVVIASTILVLTSPLLAWIAWRVRRDSPGPVFFRQERLGERMQQFTLLKFRTMAVDTASDAHREYIERIMDSAAAPEASNLYKLDRGDKVTAFGAWLRRTSLDELPQLINVLKGEMSLVGPRPCIPYETEHFAPHHFDRFLVPAGITGLWQVSARANSTFREALDLDAAYARSRSFALDMWLLARTPLVVLRGKRSTA